MYPSNNGPVGVFSPDIVRAAFKRTQELIQANNPGVDFIIQPAIIRLEAPLQASVNK